MSYSKLSPEADALFQLAEAVRDTGYRFVTITPSTHRRVNSRPRNRFAQTLIDIFGWSRPFQREVVSQELFELMQRANVVVECGEEWRSTIRLSSLGDELFLHSAYPTTAPDAVFFGPDTYRFVTALVAHLGNRQRRIGRAVDLGCGAGPGGICLAKMNPEAEVELVDINDAALGLARINARLAGADNVKLCSSDLLSAVPGTFDLIIANPPYLNDDKMRAYRHGGGPLGAQLSLRIVETAVERLCPGGSLLLYTGAAIVDGNDAFLASAEERLASSSFDWSYREVDPDVFGEELDRPAYECADRIAAVVLTATKQE